MSFVIQPMAANYEDNKACLSIYLSIIESMFVCLFAMFIQAIQFSNAGLNGGLFTY